MPDLSPLEVPGLGASSRVAGLGAEAAGAAEAGLESMEIMHRTGEAWLKGATNTEKAELLRAWLKRSGGSKSLLQMLEGESGARIVGMSSNRIPKAVLKAAGSPRSQATFTRLHTMMRQIKKGSPSAKDLEWLFNRSLKEAADAGLSRNSLDALRRMGPEALYKAGPTSVARVYDSLTKESTFRRFLRKTVGKDPVMGGKRSFTGPTQNLAADIRSQIDELEGIAKAKGVGAEVGAAEGVVGKARAGAKAAAGQVGEAVSPRGFTPAEEGIAGTLKKAGAKGLGKGARAARAAGGLGTMLAVPIIGYEVYDSLVGKSKRARAMLEASRSGGTASVSKELMYDVLDKRADLEARRAQLSRDPKLMQQIVEAIGGQRAKTLTSSETGYGVDMGPQGVSSEKMDRQINKLLEQMRGM